MAFRDVGIEKHGKLNQYSKKEQDQQVNGIFLFKYTYH